MSGECPKCKDHPVDCQCPSVGCGGYKQKFYAHGETFDTFEKMSNYCKIWLDMPCDFYEFKRQMDILVNQIEMNIEMRGDALTNREAYLLLRLSTDWAARRPNDNTPDGKGES